MNIKQLLFALLLCTFGSTLFSQGNVTTEIKIVIAKIKKGQDAQLNDSYFTESNAEAIVNEAESHVFDQSVKVRKTMYGYIHRASMKTTKSMVKQKAAETLSRACLDNDSRASILAADYLTDIEAQYFSEKAKIQLSSAFIKKKENLAEIILLLGYLQMKEHEQELLAYAVSSPDEKIKWNATVALARMENAKGIEMSVSEFNSLQCNDDLIFFKVPGMLYSHQKECFAPVIKILYKNEKACSSANPNSDEPILCGYRIMEALAPYIQNYPLETHASGSIKSNNYEKSLSEIQDWFNKKKDKYTIQSDVF